MLRSQHSSKQKCLPAALINSAMVWQTRLCGYLQSEAGMVLSLAGGRPLVVADPTCASSQSYMQLGAAVVTEVAKLQAATRPFVRYVISMLTGLRSEDCVFLFVVCTCRCW